MLRSFFSVTSRSDGACVAQDRHGARRGPGIQQVGHQVLVAAFTSLLCRTPHADKSGHTADAEDRDAFYDDFAAVFAKLIELGVERTDDVRSHLPLCVGVTRLTDALGSAVRECAAVLAGSGREEGAGGQGQDVTRLVARYALYPLFASLLQFAYPCTCFSPIEKCETCIARRPSLALHQIWRVRLRSRCRRSALAIRRCELAEHPAHAHRSRSAFLRASEAASIAAPLSRAERPGASRSPRLVSPPRPPVTAPEQHVGLLERRNDGHRPRPLSPRKGRRALQAQRL